MQYRARFVTVSPKILALHIRNLFQLIGRIHYNKFARVGKSGDKLLCVCLTMSALSTSSTQPDYFCRSFGGNVVRRSIIRERFVTRNVNVIGRDFRRISRRRLRCRGDSFAGSSSTGGEGEDGWDYRDIVSGFASKFSQGFRGMVDMFRTNLDIRSKREEEEKDMNEEWQRWVSHFRKVEMEERSLQELKACLTDAVKSEDYGKAAKLKLLVAEKLESDTAGLVMSELMKAIKDDRYGDAAQIRDDTAAGLVGWWIGFSQNEDDPYGKLIHVTPKHGRFVATSYNARQLASGASGIPLFEIFVTKNDDQGYNQKVVYLQSNVQSLHDSPSVFPDSSELSETDKDKIDDPDLDVEDEGLKCVLKFLRRRMPGLNFRVLKTAAPAQSKKDLLSGVLEQFIQDVIEQREKQVISEGYVSEPISRDDLYYGKIPVEANSNFLQHVEVAAAKVAIGNLIQRIVEDAPLTAPVHLSAKLERMDRESFSFHIEDKISVQTGRKKKFGSSWRITAISSRASGDSKPSKGPLNIGGVSVKALEDLGEIITLAVTEAQKKRTLLGSTVFHRISIPKNADSDPFSGLYTHAFGPHTAEVIQLHHRFGQWQEDNNMSSQSHSDIEFYEYVEAIKLIGDGSVSSGQVIFRAKIGKQYQLPFHDTFPEELCVTARYKGEERGPYSGLDKSKWSEAELLLIDNKGKGNASGPHLGFLSSHHIIPVLFNKLKLPQ